MADDNKCSLLNREFAGCKKRAKIWIAALGKSGEPEDLSQIAIIAQERVDTAFKVAPLLQNHWETSPKFKSLTDFSSKLGEIAGYYKTALKVEKDVKALKQIYDAMSALENQQIFINDPAAAAKAFDQLFMGFGTLAKKFPPPFDSTIGEFLYECGKTGFFGAMNEKMFGEDTNMAAAKSLLDGNYRGYNIERN